MAHPMNSRKDLEVSMASYRPHVANIVPHVAHMPSLKTNRSQRNAPHDANGPYI